MIRHLKALAAARRREELQAVRAGLETAVDAMTEGGEIVGGVDVPAPVSSVLGGLVEAPVDVLALAVEVQPVVSDDLVVIINTKALSPYDPKPLYTLLAQEAQLLR